MVPATKKFGRGADGPVMIEYPPPPETARGPEILCRLIALIARTAPVSWCSAFGVNIQVGPDIDNVADIAT